jgi:hypothetical protein
MQAKRRLPTWATILAWLGVIGTILGVVTGIIALGQFAQQTIGPTPASSADQANVYATLAAYQVSNDRLAIQLTQYALAQQQSANQSTANAINAQSADVQGTLSALQALQDALVATQNANAGLTAVAQANNATATENYLNAGATNAALSQIAPTNTPQPTATATPAPVVDYRSLTDSSIEMPQNNRLVFTVQTAQAIPDQPPVGLAYSWLLDTDQNPATGLSVQDIGVDVRVTVRYGDGAWLGAVRAVLVDGAEGSERVFTAIEVSGSSLSAIVNPGKVGIPATFDWVVRAQSDQEVYPFLPASGHLGFTP